MVKIYKQPFAHDGDTIAIPDASQPDGKMSSADGWTPDYQLPKTDPNYKPVGRQEMNGVFKEVTEALGQVQVQGAASWSPDGAPYPVNAQVYRNGKQWLALRPNSVEPAEGEDWSAIGTAATRDVGGSAGNVMAVGAFGLGVSGTAPLFSGDINNLTTIGFYLADASDTTNLPLLTGAFSVVVDHANSGIRSMQTAKLQDTESLRIFSRKLTNSGWTPWLELLHTGNILQSTGTSTDYPMSQKAVTDQLLGVGQTWQDVTGSRIVGTTYTNTTGRTIQVSASLGVVSQGQIVSVLVDGVTVVNNQTQGYSVPISFSVPAGSTYTASSSGVTSWSELR